MQTCTLTLAESEFIMVRLVELPIKYLQLVQEIQALLQLKFEQAKAYEQAGMINEVLTQQVEGK